jgi:Electron transfer DM13
MKHFTTLALTLSLLAAPLAFAAAPVPAAAPADTMTKPETMKPGSSMAAMKPLSGKLSSIHAPTVGTVTITHTAGGDVLSIKGLKTEVAPDLEVWLLASAAPKTEADDVVVAKTRHLQVAVLKTFSGDFSFKLPAGTKVSDYRSVILWCAQFNVTFGGANLK